MKALKPTIIAALLLLLTACSSKPPMATVDYVDIQRFMGDWYVIANIPTFLEKGAHNPIESYRLDSDGSIATTFTFNADSFDGDEKNLPTPRFCHKPPNQRRMGHAIYMADQSRLQNRLSGCRVSIHRYRPQQPRLCVDNGAQPADTRPDIH